MRLLGGAAHTAGEHLQVRAAVPTGDRGEADLPAYDGAATTRVLLPPAGIVGNSSSSRVQAGRPLPARPGCRSTRRGSPAAAGRTALHQARCPAGNRKSPLSVCERALGVRGGQLEPIALPYRALQARGDVASFGMQADDVVRSRGRRGAAAADHALGHDYDGPRGGGRQRPPEPHHANRDLHDVPR
jgi:hypothetical protein